MLRFLLAPLLRMTKRQNPFARSLVIQPDVAAPGVTMRFGIQAHYIVTHTVQYRHEYRDNFWHLVNQDALNLPVALLAVCQLDLTPRQDD